MFTMISVTLLALISFLENTKKGFANERDDKYKMQIQYTDATGSSEFPPFLQAHTHEC